ncbi:transposase family protein [Actinoplanes sp. NPDC051475]|uniref:transposase family protein n=1 Tax=Actinoplanes sp. NPDC051475 TaxID=3157225 RepID=UPI00344CE304
MSRRCIPEAEVVFTATVRGEVGVCPACSKPSVRVHSRYRRTLTDAPVAGRLIRILLRVRRFFCGNPRVPAQDVR